MCTKVISTSKAHQHLKCKKPTLVKGNFRNHAIVPPNNDKKQKPKHCAYIQSEKDVTRDQRKIYSKLIIFELTYINALMKLKKKYLL